MFRRILFFTACLGVFAAVAAAGVSAKDGFKITLTLDPVPPATQTTLAFNCEVTFEGKVAYIDCHNAEPNPFPPKDEKTVTVRRNGQAQADGVSRRRGRTHCPVEGFTDRGLNPQGYCRSRSHVEKRRAGFTSPSAAARLFQRCCSSWPPRPDSAELLGRLAASVDAARARMEALTNATVEAVR